MTTKSKRDGLQLRDDKTLSIFVMGRERTRGANVFLEDTFTYGTWASEGFVQRGALGEVFNIFLGGPK